MLWQENNMKVKLWMKMSQFTVNTTWRTTYYLANTPPPLNDTRPKL